MPTNLKTNSVKKKFTVVLFNPLAPELNAQCGKQETGI